MYSEYCVVVPSIFGFLSNVQPNTNPKTLFALPDAVFEYPMNGKVIFVGFVPLNAAPPIFVTLFGTVILVIKLQFSNALSPMLVTPSGILKSALLKEEQLTKADAPICVRLAGKLHVSKLLQLRNTQSLKTLMLSDKTTSFSEVQLENAYVPIFVTESGISKLVSEVQPLNPEFPILSIP